MAWIWILLITKALTNRNQAGTDQKNREILWGSKKDFHWNVKEHNSTLEQSLQSNVSCFGWNLLHKYQIQYKIVKLKFSRYSVLNFAILINSWNWESIRFTRTYLKLLIHIFSGHSTVLQICKVNCNHNFVIFYLRNGMLAEK